MERGQPSGGDSSLMGPNGFNDSSLMGPLCDYSSLMGPFGGVGGGLQSQMNLTPENGPSNPSVEVHANNGNEESPDHGTTRITEIGSSTAGKNKKRHGGRQDAPQPNKSLHQRATSQQLEKLEGFFNICAHPDNNQRRQLSEATGLLLRQVKFWFQNKRTQVKNLSGREENYRLRVENETLKEEINRLRQLQGNVPAPPPCPRCINDPGHLLLEKEVERLQGHIQMLQQELQLYQSTNIEIPPMVMDSASSSFQVDPSLENVFVVQHDEQMLANLTQNAAQELLFLAEPNCPLWLNVPGGIFETLNMVAYALTFPGQMGVDTIVMKTEATRASAVVMMDPSSLVEFLLDAESYGTMLPGLISGAATTKVYSHPTSRKECYDGAMQMMTAEMVFPSPLVSARKYTFVRCVKKLEQGAIAVIDVSLDDGARCRKMPSGLVIQPIRYNTCKVTAIDHVLVDGASTHGLFSPCLSGLLFGARRWVMGIARQFARLRDVFHVTNCTLNVTSRGRMTIMKLADNLLASFTSSVAANPEDAWTTQCGLGTEQDIKIMYKTQNESSSSDSNTNIVVVSASASFLVPLHMAKAFELLKNNMLRAKWDVLVNGGSVKEEVRVANGAGSNDAASILHVKHGHGANKDTTMILQNTCYDASGAYMVYSPLDKQLLEIMGDNQAMGNITLFPAGFSLVPLTDPAGQDGAGIAHPGATVMTAGFQILMKLASENGLCSDSVTTVVQIMTNNIANVKEALLNSHPIFYKSIHPAN